MKNKILIIILILVMVLLFVFITLKLTKGENYYIKASAIDKNSPDVKLIVYENDVQIEVEAIYYTNGVLLCDGKNLTTNRFNIKNNDQMKVILKNSKEIMAKVVMEE